MGDEKEQTEVKKFKMQGKNLIIIGGALTAMFGVLFLINYLGVRETLVISDKVLSIIIFALPICLIFAGVFGVLTGISNNWTLFTIDHIFWDKLALFVVLILGSIYIVRKELLLPLFGKMEGLIPESIIGLLPDDKLGICYLLSIIFLAVSIHISHTGLEITSGKGCDSWVLSHSFTRLLYIIPIGIIFIEEALEKFAGKMSPLAFASGIVWFFVFFENTRKWGDHYSISKMVFRTIISVPVLIIYLALIFLFSWLISWFSNLTFIIPLACIIAALCFTGREISRSDYEITESDRERWRQESAARASTNQQSSQNRKRSSSIKIYYKGDGKYVYETDDDRVFTSTKDSGGKLTAMSAKDIEEMKRRQAEGEQRALIAQREAESRKLEENSRRWQEEESRRRQEEERKKYS